MMWGGWVKEHGRIEKTGVTTINACKKHPKAPLPLAVTAVTVGLPEGCKSCLKRK